MKYYYTKILILISFIIVISQFNLFSQTVDVYPRSNFSVNDTFMVTYTVDSLLNEYSLDEIFTSDKKLKMEILSVRIKRLLPDSSNYLNEEEFDIKERIQDSTDKIFIELSQTDNENVFVYNSHQPLCEIIGLEDNEFLTGIRFYFEFYDWILDRNKVCPNNTNSNSITTNDCWVDLYPFDNLKKDKKKEFIISNYIKNNLDVLIKENTEDLLLEKDSNGETVFSQNMGLRNPIIEDMNGDGINDIVSQIYQYSVGDVSTILSDKEKEKIISRWGVFLGTNSDTDSLVYEVGFIYNQKSEGCHFTKVDIDNDGFSDLLSGPEVYHGLDENRPDYYGENRHRPTMVYINNGDGTFSVDSLIPICTDGSVIQLDNDDEYEFIGKLKNWGENGKEITTIYSWDYGEKVVFQGEYSTNYEEIVDFENYDLNKDGFQDVIMLGTNSNDTTRTFTLLVYEGSEEGVDLNEEVGKILYEFEDNIKVGTEGNPLSILKFNEETDLFLLYLINSEYNCYYDTSGEFKTLFRGFEVVDGELVEVTEKVFPDNLNVNKLSPPNTPIFVDMDGDGFTDLCFNRETWFKETEPISISYLKNNGTYFEPRYFSTFDISLNGFPSDIHFLDIDSDGNSEMIFDKNPFFEPIMDMNLDFVFSPFEVIYENEPPTNINLSNTSISENSDEETEIGILTTVDSDTMDSHTFYLASGSGDSGNQYFTIKDNKLLSNVMFDYESQNSYSIRIQSEDGKGGMFSKSFTIEITNEVEVGVQNLFDSDDIKIYPNPVTDKVIVEINNSTPLQMVLTDGLGNKVLEQTLQNPTTENNLNNLTSGLYIINLMKENTIVHRQKFIKH
ncbi:T9SS type A sorting domain-containing protein [uncultured Draconibacterium sp.]|uniref:T9SS type A sorting domain-containing protein n=1 Tax=uncultured Draconibacterium sp. TaxID=1573823 RepID=UPI0025ED5893|nr:T9SS type A sorting domain-containing protein [uncultured Draconibacterium sp.]